LCFGGLSFFRFSALKPVEKDAAAKDPTSAHNLGVFYLEKKDEKAAFEEFCKAASKTTFGRVIASF
jgi:hypothetical protein